MDVSLKELTDRFEILSKETMSRRASKATNKKGNKFAKKQNEATSPEVIVCDDSGDDASGWEGGTLVNSLVKKTE